MVSSGAAGAGKVPPTQPVLRCEMCGAALHHEAWVTAERVEPPLRPRMLSDLKSLEWVVRSGMHATEEHGVIACSQECHRRWLGGAERRPVPADASAYTLPNRRAGPQPEGVCLSTKTHSQEQIEEIYREVLVGGLPPGLPERAVREIFTAHGAVLTFKYDSRRGIACAAFQLGEVAESFFIGCHRTPLPPGVCQDGEARGRLQVEFAQYMEEVNPYLFDDVFGSKATRQLLRAMPRRLPTPLDAAQSEEAFEAFEARLRRMRDSPDWRDLLRANETDSDVLVAANWLDYKYNEERPFGKARLMLSASNGDLGRALQRLDFTHIDRIVAQEEARQRQAAEQRAAPPRAGGRCGELRRRLPGPHAVATAVLVGVLARLLTVLLQRML